MTQELVFAKTQYVANADALSIMFFDVSTSMFWNSDITNEEFSIDNKQG